MLWVFTGTRIGDINGADIVSTKASISYSEKHHLYNQELLGENPASVFLEIINPSEYRMEKETFQGKSIETLTVEISLATMDQIAIDWIEKRELQGAVRGLMEAQPGSSDNPRE